MRERCAAALRDLGFEVGEERFEYSTWPGRWGTPAAGWLSLLAFAATTVLLGRDEAGAALAALAATLLVLAVGGVLVARRGVLDLPWARAVGVNLVARREADAGAGASPHPVLLVAHTDTKSQPIPSAARAAGVVLLALGWAGMLWCAGALVAGAGRPAWLTAVELAGFAGAALLAASTVGERSPGALDDGSGIVTVLHAAAALPRHLPVEVLITSGEELGLAGSRAHVRARRARGTPAPRVLNVDGVDERGTLVAMWSGRRPGPLLDTFERAGRTEGSTVSPRRLVPGILTDAVAFADAGWEAVTLMRGTWASLARVHRPGDDLSHFATGEGMAEAARVLAAAAALCAEHGPGRPTRSPER